jgi:hypothetical protein
MLCVAQIRQISLFDILTIHINEYIICIKGKYCMQTGLDMSEELNK